MGFLIFLGGAVFGAVIGAGIMCCLQINRIHEYGRKKDEKNDPPHIW